GHFYNDAVIIGRHSADGRLHWKVLHPGGRREHTSLAPGRYARFEQCDRTLLLHQAHCCYVRKASRSGDRHIDGTAPLFLCREWDHHDCAHTDLALDGYLSTWNDHPNPDVYCELLVRH